MEERQGPQTTLGITIEKPLEHSSGALGIVIFSHGPGREGETESGGLPRVQNLRNPGPGDRVLLCSLNKVPGRRILARKVTHFAGTCQPGSREAALWKECQSNILLSHLNNNMNLVQSPPHILLREKEMIVSVMRVIGFWLSCLRWSTSWVPLTVPSFLLNDAELCKSEDAGNHVSGILGGQSTRL